MTMHINTILDGFSSTALLHFGAGQSSLGPVLDAVQYGDVIVNYTAVDAQLHKITKLADECPSIISSDFSYKLVTDTLQNWIDTHLESTLEYQFDTVLITGVFDNTTYGSRQYDFIFKTVESCLNLLAISTTTMQKSVVFTLDTAYDYNPHYVFTYLIGQYTSVTVRKISDTHFIFQVFPNGNM